MKQKMDKKTSKEVIALQDKFNNETNGFAWRKGITKNGKIIDWDLALLQETSEMIDSVSWKHWKNIDKPADIGNIKIELVDILHFLISRMLVDYSKKEVQGILAIGYEIAYKDSINGIEAELIKCSEKADMCFSHHLIAHSKTFMKHILSLSDIKEKDEKLSANLALSLVFFNICKLLDFTWEDMYKLYISKNCLNTFRQKNGYKTGTYIKNWGKDEVEDNKIITDLLEKELLSFDELYSKLEVIYKDMNKDRL